MGTKEQNLITSFLKENPSFTTKVFLGMVKESQAAYSDRKAYRMLKDLQDVGRIMKVGRGHYSKAPVKSPYHFKASSLMDELVSLIDKEYPLITYQTLDIGYTMLFNIVLQLMNLKRIIIKQ